MSYAEEFVHDEEEIKRMENKVLCVCVYRFIDTNNTHIVTVLS